MKTATIVLCFLCLGCSNNDDSENNSQVITPILISQMELMGNEGIPAQNIVINQAIDWELLKVSMHDRVNFFTETDIDFDEFVILAVFDQVYPNGGHSIDITSVVEHQNNIIVTVDQLLPGGAQAVIQQPYHIVKIPMTSKPVLFEMSFN